MIYSSTNKKKLQEPLFLTFYGVYLTRTFAKGRTNFKRMDHKHGHCIICGYEPGRKAKRRNEQRIMFQVDVLQFVAILLNHYENIPMYFPF